jgi:hypothetical protein
LIPKENVSNCLTKHLAHPQLWALIKEHLFHCWNEHHEVSMALALPDGVAPDGECQAGNSIGQEQVCVSQDGWWHLVFIGHSWMVLVMVSGRCLIIPVTCEHLGMDVGIHVSSEANCAQQDDSKARFDHEAGLLTPN